MLLVYLERLREKGSIVEALDSMFLNWKDLFFLYTGFLFDQHALFHPIMHIYIYICFNYMAFVSWSPHSKPLLSHSGMLWAIKNCFGKRHYSEAVCWMHFVSSTQCVLPLKNSCTPKDSLSPLLCSALFAKMYWRGLLNLRANLEKIRARKWNLLHCTSDKITEVGLLDGGQWYLQ